MTIYVLAKRNLDGFMAARLIAKARHVLGCDPRGASSLNTHRPKHHRYFIAANEHSDIVYHTIDELDEEDMLLVLGMELDHDAYRLVRDKGAEVRTFLATDEQQPLSREEERLIGRTDGINLSACDMIHFRYWSCAYAAETSEIKLTGCLMRDRIRVYVLSGERRIKTYILKGLYESALHSQVAEDREYSEKELLEAPVRNQPPVDIRKSKAFYGNLIAELAIDPPEYEVDQRDEVFAKGVSMNYR